MNPTNLALDQSQIYDEDNSSAKTASSENSSKDGSLKSHTAVSPLQLQVDLAQSWLAWQCKMVAGIVRGALYQPVSAERAGKVITTWPGEGEGGSQMLEAAHRALSENRGLVKSQQPYGPGGKRSCDLIASPLMVDNKLIAVVVVMVSVRSEPQQHAVLQLLQWGGLWVETLVEHRMGEDRASTLDLMTAIVSHTDFHTAAIESVNMLADLFECERVSIGFRQGLKISLQALSHVATFDARSQLVRKIESAMEEAVDQSSIILQPVNAADGTVVSRSHNELAEQQGSGSVCTIPLLGHAGIIGAITLERGLNKPFDKNAVEWCHSLAKLISPALEQKQSDERHFLSKTLDVLMATAATVIGFSHLKPKLIALLLLLMVTALSIVEGSYKVTAPASIEGAVRQVLVAPQDGYVKQSAVRAGEEVKKGQLMATLDDRSLKLERSKWQSERNKLEKEYQGALAKGDRTGLSILRAQLDQVDAEIKLVEELISRTQVYAPFDGIVVSGDLSQSLGVSVKTGQVLFEVASLDSYRVVLEVADHDVAGLDEGKSGHLIIAALPQTTFPISLDKLVPVAVSAEGNNYFRVGAALDEQSPLLRPSMQGVAKVDMGQRSLLWIWTHKVVDRIRLWAWSVGLQS